MKTVELLSLCEDLSVIVFGGKRLAIEPRDELVVVVAGNPDADNESHWTEGEGLDLNEALRLLAHRLCERASRFTPNRNSYIAALRSLAMEGAS